MGPGFRLADIKPLSCPCQTSTYIKAVVTVCITCRHGKLHAVSRIIGTFFGEAKTFHIAYGLKEISCIIGQDKLGRSLYSVVAMTDKTTNCQIVTALIDDVTKCHTVILLIDGTGLPCRMRSILQTAERAL